MGGFSFVLDLEKAIISDRQGNWAFSCTIQVACYEPSMAINLIYAFHSVYSKLLISIMCL